MIVTLERWCQGPPGTFGHLVVAGETLYTVERPWAGNRPFVSCIPAGDYRCTPRRYHRGGYDAIGIGDVPGRSLILFHKANRPTDVSGCIGVGLQLGCLDGRWAVLRSREAFELLMASLGAAEWTVRILPGAAELAAA